MPYPYVNIINWTDYEVSGVVRYASAFCSNDKYSVKPTEKWEATSRGVCLVTKIEATIKTPSGKEYSADSYTSSGTSYSCFAIRQNYAETGVFKVVRIDCDEVTNTNDTKNYNEDYCDDEIDEIPSDYVEPTEQQK